MGEILRFNWPFFIKDRGWASFRMWAPIRINMLKVKMCREKCYEIVYVLRVKYKIVSNYLSLKKYFLIYAQFFVSPQRLQA